MEIFVRAITGKTLTLCVNPSDTTETLKNLLYDSEDIPPVQQKIIFDGKQLACGKTLSDSNIENGSTLFLSLSIRLFGG